MRHECSRISRATLIDRGLIRRSALSLVLACLLCLASGYTTRCWAALGGDVSSVTADAQQLKADVSVATRADYAVHELKTPAGTIVREFVAPSGVVFAVSWQGPLKPSMPLLLGRYYDSYANAPRNPNSSRSRAMIEQPDLIVHAGGHMRSFAGVAYVPQLLPAHVVEGDLQ